MLGPSELDPHSLLIERSALNLSERIPYWATLVVQWSVYAEAKGTLALWDMLVLILKINVSSSLIVITCSSQPLIVPPTPLHLSRKEFCNFVVGKAEHILPIKIRRFFYLTRWGPSVPNSTSIAGCDPKWGGPSAGVQGCSMKRRWRTLIF